MSSPPYPEIRRINLETQFVVGYRYGTRHISLPLKHILQRIASTISGNANQNKFLLLS